MSATSLRTNEGTAIPRIARDNYLGTDTDGADYYVALGQCTVYVDPEEGDEFTVELGGRDRSLSRFCDYVEKKIGWAEGPKLARNARVEWVDRDNVWGGR